MGSYKLKIDIGNRKAGDIVSFYFYDKVECDKENNLYIYWINIDGIKYGSAVNKKNSELVIDKLFERL